MDFLSESYISILIGIAFGALFCWLGIRATRKTKFEGMLSLIVHSRISLFHQVIDFIPGISITYQGVPIDKNVYLFQATLVNIGNTDVDESSVRDSLKCCLPGAHHFVDVKLSGCYVGPNVRFNEKKNCFEIPIINIKPGEKIFLNIMAKLAYDEDYAPFFLLGRIANTSIGEVLDAHAIDQNRGPVFKSIMSLVSAIITFIGICTWIFYGHEQILESIGLSIFVLFFLIYSTVGIAYNWLDLHKKKKYLRFLFRRDLLSFRGKVITGEGILG